MMIGQFRMTIDGRRSAAARLGLFLLVLSYPLFGYIHGIEIRLGPFIDFPSFYGAAQLAASGHSPYGRDALAPLAANLGRPVFPFIYPPIGLLPFVPLASLSY